MSDSRFSWTGQLWPVAQLGMSSVRQAEPDTWVDIPCHIVDCDLFSGRDRFTDRFEAGTATITFTNEDGWADLIGPGADAQAASAAATLRPGRPIRIGIAAPWTGAIVSTRWLWRGWIDSCTPRYDPVEHDVVEVGCVDALGEAGKVTAPAAAFQGANETVSDRIHRVLNAIGWWSPKRSIAASTTQVQGTSLGSQAMDLMGQAADSDGGVVFGTVDGDVAFRGLNWMLYSATTDPDDCIGNEATGSSSPSLPGPPHIDPTCGPVYRIPCPPFDPPPPICVTAAAFDSEGFATNGTLVEQGDTFRLFVADGELFYMWMGTTWDMGPFSTADNTSVDGTVTVCVTPPPPGSPPGTPPTRPDCPECGTPGEVPFSDLPTPCGVTLLAYSDGGYVLIDPIGYVEDPKQVITVGPITPVKGCMLLLLVNAIRYVDGDTLQPFSSTADVTVIGTTSTGSIDGGGLTWQPCVQAQNYFAGDTEVYGAVAQVRNDMDPFGITIDWNGDGASKEHIACVWQIVCSVPDLYDRMTLGNGDFIYGVTAGLAGVSPPPGDGPYTLKLDNRFSNDNYTKPDDILIAQSLAEQLGPPYGASFDDTDGEWVVPVMVPRGTPPAPELLVDAPVCDDFERADGPLGSSWIVGPGPGWATVAVPMAIDAGAAVGPTAIGVSGDYFSNAMSWGAVADPAAVQSVEVTVENIWASTTAQYVALLTNQTAGTKASQFADFQFGTAGVIQVQAFHFDVDGNQSPCNEALGNLVNASHAGTEPVVLRLESNPDGTQQIFIDDVSVMTWVDSGHIVGNLIGMAIDVQEGDTSPRILEACIGGGGAQLKASWIAGARTGFAQSNATWSDVNFGHFDIVSSEVAVNIEMDQEASFRWGVLDWGMEGAPGAPLTPGSRVGYFGRVAPNSIVLVYVGVMMADTDISASINVTSPDMTFALAYHQPKGAGNRAQGAVFWAKTSSVEMPPTQHASYSITWGSNTIDKLSWVAYEVTNAEAIAAVGGTTFGTHTDGSVDGPGSFSLGAAPATTSVVLAFLNVSVSSNAIENGSLPGTGWTEDLELIPNPSQYAYIDVQSRDASTDTSVSWTDLYEGATSHGTEAVAMAVEITPTTEFAGWQTTAALEVGGARDQFSGPIYNVTAYNSDDSVLWTMDPMGVVMPP